MINAKFLFKGTPSTWTDEETAEFVQDDFETLLDRETQPQCRNLGSVLHTEVAEFDHIGKTMIEFSWHPLGSVYVHNGFGYVASGYQWLRFDIDLLDIFSDEEE